MKKRFSISLGLNAYDFLKDKSKKLGISVGELIRRIVDDWMER